MPDLPQGLEADSNVHVITPCGVAWGKVKKKEFAMPLDAVLRAGRRLEAEAPARFRLEAAGPLARAAEAPTADPWWDNGRKERERRDGKEAAACQRLPDGLHGIDSSSFKQVVDVNVSTFRLSRASAFELVRQALAACPDRKTNHPYTQHILAYLQTLGGSVDAAKLGQLEEMISFWRNRQYKVPKDVQEALLHHDKSKWGQFGGQEPTTDAFLFVLGCSLAAATTVPFLWWFFAASALSAAGSRAVAAVSGLERQQKLRDFLTNSASGVGPETTEKFTAAGLTNLFDWIAEFLSKALAPAFQPAPADTMPNERFEFRVEYSDELKTPDDAERIRGEMHKLVEDFARMPREQLPSAASLDAEFGLGEATGLCVKGPSATLPSTAKNKKGVYKTWLTNVTVPAIVSGNTKQTALVLVKTDQDDTKVEYKATGGKGIYTPMTGQDNQSMQLIASLKTVTFFSGKLVTFELTLPDDTPLEIKYDYSPGKNGCIETNAFKLAEGSPTPPDTWSQWREELPRLARDIARAATTAGCAAGGICVYAFKEK